jgi:hypothetical protein
LRDDLMRLRELQTPRIRRRMLIRWFPSLDEILP